MRVDELVERLAMLPADAEIGAYGDQFSANLWAFLADGEQIDVASIT